MVQPEEGFHRVKKRWDLEHHPAQNCPACSLETAHTLAEHKVLSPAKLRSKWLGWENCRLCKIWKSHSLEEHETEAGKSPSLAGVRGGQQILEKMKADFEKHLEQERATREELLRKQFIAQAAQQVLVSLAAREPTGDRVREACINSSVQYALELVAHLEKCGFAPWKIDGAVSSERSEK